MVFFKTSGVFLFSWGWELVSSGHPILWFFLRRNNTRQPHVL